MLYIVSPLATWCVAGRQSFSPGVFSRCASFVAPPALDLPDAVLGVVLGGVVEQATKVTASNAPAIIFLTVIPSPSIMVRILRVLISFHEILLRRAQRDKGVAHSSPPATPCDRRFSIARAKRATRL